MTRRFLTLRRILAVFLLLILLVLVAVGGLLAFEARTSWFEAQPIADYAKTLHYRLVPGASDAIRFPADGPFDLRYGYVQIPHFQQRLTARGYRITSQARFGPGLMEYTGRGLFPPYREKDSAGLRLEGCAGESLYATTHPGRQYVRFEDIPPLVVNTLLFIENRDLLDPERPRLNPATDWVRLSRAALGQAEKFLHPDYNAPGGSTLATQIEKYRHSPDGLTLNIHDKLVQMASASVRAYRDGIDTLPARQRVVLDYVNTVPLSAQAGFGEVNGLGDGLWLWFGTDFASVNRILAEGSKAPVAERGRLLRQVLSLMIAHRRPSYYLARGRAELAKLVDSHLRLLAQGGVIAPELRDAALAEKVSFRDPALHPATERVEADKGTLSQRARVAGLLDVSQYELDRFDLRVRGNLDGALQKAVDRFLAELSDPEKARERGIIGERLLTPAQLGKVDYSFTLMEKGEDGNRVRVQTDTSDALFDINESSKLELGSTAKLRVLATYLEIVAELHQRYAGDEAEALRRMEGARLDPLSRWAVDYLAKAEDRSLPPMLSAALDRRYSASPRETFFTGGGLMTFRNFRHDEDGATPSVRDALRGSINLAFVRIMRDVVRYEMYQVPGSTARVLDEKDDEARRNEYLARFADREGTEFLRRFWRKHQGRSAQVMQDSILDSLHSADRIAAAWRYLNPSADYAAFAAAMQARMEEDAPREKRLQALYERFAPGAWSLADQGYLARVHPLELWLVAWRIAHPEGGFADAVKASTAERQEVYRWLFRTRARNAQDVRIRTMQEVEAFLEIHRRWARLGYPFDRLVPSLATALGSSGDRPAALAELMGVIMNDGMRLPVLHIDTLHFAVGTPYETVLRRQPEAAEQVMQPEVAAALREALGQVVEGGTARRLNGVFLRADGSELPTGGKTGTGDNRLYNIGAGGVRTGGVARNRTATFVFYLGERHFGTLTAYVTGPEASSFSFTSGLPVQILRSMAPVLNPYLGDHPQRACPPVAVITPREVPARAPADAPQVSGPRVPDAASDPAGQPKAEASGRGVTGVVTPATKAAVSPAPGMAAEGGKAEADKKAGAGTGEGSTTGAAAADRVTENAPAAASKPDGSASPVGPAFTAARDAAQPGGRPAPVGAGAAAKESAAAPGTSTHPATASKPEHAPAGLPASPQPAASPASNAASPSAAPTHATSAKAPTAAQP